MVVDPRWYVCPGGGSARSPGTISSWRRLLWSPRASHRGVSGGGRGSLAWLHGYCTAVLFGLGDVIAQFISVEKGEKFKLDLPVSVALILVAIAVTHLTEGGTCFHLWLPHPRSISSSSLQFSRMADSA